MNHLSKGQTDIWLGTVRYRVSIQWLCEHQHQTCITESETPNAELLLLIIIIWAHLQAAGAERYEFTRVHSNVAFLLCALNIPQIEMTDI